MAKFDLSSTTQVISFTHSLQQKLYARVNKVTQSKCGNIGMRFVGFGVGLSSSALMLTGIVGSLGECVIKGFGNLVKSTYAKNGSHFFKGIQVTFIGIPLSAASTLLAPIYLTVGTIITTFAVLICPQKYTAYRYNDHLQSAIVP